MAASSPASGGRENSVQVIAKAAAILDALAENRETSAAGLAARLGEPRSSVYRLLSSLQQLDMVDTGTKRGSYRLGLKLLRLGSAVQGRLDIRTAAMPTMERIHDETGETVFLCVRRGDDAVCVERLDGRRVTSLALRLGGALPLHAGAAPRSLLAFEPRARWNEFLAGGELERFSPVTPVTADELIPMLESIRRNGVSVSDEDVTPGIAAIGAPVFDHRGEVSAALSVSGMREAIMGERDGGTVRHLIVNGAAEVSRALGHDTRHGARVGPRDEGLTVDLRS
ncbi:MAG TPA: IclR family transcriptional regulator [Solirubrobacteraceae bacterium]